MDDLQVLYIMFFWNFLSELNLESMKLSDE